MIPTGETEGVGKKDRTEPELHCKIQSVPRSKHTPSLLLKSVS